MDDLQIVQSDFEELGLVDSPAEISRKYLVFVFVFLES